MSALAGGQRGLSARRARARLLCFLGEIGRYGAASLLALGLDYGLLMILTKRLGVAYPQAAAAGFLSGLALIYLLSVRYVFEGRRRRAPRVEILGFLLTGLAGLALTEVLMHLFVDRAGLPVALAKAPTSGLVFLFNFTARRTLLFSSAPRR